MVGTGEAAREPGLLDRLAWLVRQLEWRALRVARDACPLCGGRTFVRFARDPLGTRCVSCLASPISVAIGRVVLERVPRLGEKRVCELSARGPFVAFLARALADGPGRLCCSEYFDDCEPGEVRGGVSCQDVQRLTHADASFDLCTSTEVFEHVPDDARGFREIHRVLAPGGLFVFTVPMHDADRTLERARRLASGAIEHLEPPLYHDDVIRGASRVLVYRDYGRDITQRLEAAGFREAEIVLVPAPGRLCPDAPVVVAVKP